MSAYQQVDRNQKRPTKAAMATMWRSIEPKLLDRARPAGLKSYLSAWSSVLKHGRVEFAQFAIPVNPTLAWYLSRNRFDECEFFNKLLKRISRLTGVPEFMRNPRLPLELSFVDPLMLDGKLATKLVWGGPYASYQGREIDAKKKGVDASRALIGNRYAMEDFWISETMEKWSDWFLGIAWDSTIFVFDKRNSILSILAGTDTD